MDIQRTDTKSRKRRQQILLGVGGALVIGLGTWGLATLEPAAPHVDLASVWTDTVQRGEFLRQVRGPGTLVPTQIRWIAAESNARVERILVKPGARVIADTVILQLSNPEVEDQLLATRSALAAEEADLAAQQIGQRRLVGAFDLLVVDLLVAGIEAGDVGVARLGVGVVERIGPRLRHAQGRNAGAEHESADLRHGRLALMVWGARFPPIGPSRVVVTLISSPTILASPTQRSPSATLRRLESVMRV